MLPLSSALLLQVTRADVSRMLRADALELVLGAVLVAAALAAMLVQTRLLRRKEPSLPWFGLFALLYGVRLLARTDTFPLFFPVRPAFWTYLASAITYTVPVTAVAFLRAAFPRWTRPLGFAVVFLGAFAVCGVAADALLGRPEAARTPNNLIAISFLVVALALLFRPGWTPEGDLRTLRLGLLSFSVTAAADNLRGLGLLRWRGPDVEPVGFTVLVACLGTLAARRALAAAERLLALDKELDIARGIQSSILPASLPRLAGLALAARYQPMTAVAGDFYDVVVMDDGRLGVLVADVSGHGVPAALIASMVKVAIAAQKPHGDRPAAVLAGMHDTLNGQLGGQYVTAAYLFLDRAAGLMRYAAAGHPPLLRWRRGEPEVAAIEENGLPLGLLDLARYGEVEQPLLAGDRFLLYTDGLVDAVNAAGEAFGLERAQTAVRETARLPVDAAADLILERTHRWDGKAAADDLTLVLVDCL
jgi:sigma-B regulation protein RsbU (phosphoserine phosphatase)